MRLVCRPSYPSSCRHAAEGEHQHRTHTHRTHCADLDYYYYWTEMRRCDGGNAKGVRFHPPPFSKWRSGRSIDGRYTLPPPVVTERTKKNKRYENNSFQVYKIMLKKKYFQLPVSITVGETHRYSSSLDVEVGEKASEQRKHYAFQDFVVVVVVAILRGCHMIDMSCVPVPDE